MEVPASLRDGEDGDHRDNSPVGSRAPLRTLYPRPPLVTGLGCLKAIGTKHGILSWVSVRINDSSASVKLSHSPLNSDFLGEPAAAMTLRQQLCHHALPGKFPASGMMGLRKEQKIDL